MCKVTGINETLLLDSLRTAEPVKAANLEHYINMANVLSSIIRLCLFNTDAEQKNPVGQPGTKRQFTG